MVGDGSVPGLEAIDLMEAESMDRVTLRDVRRKEWFSIDNRVVDRFGNALGSTAMAVYMSLVRRGNATSETVVSIAKIGEAVGLGETAVRKALEKLERADLIAINYRRNERGDQASQYLICEVPFDLRPDWETRPKPERLVIDSTPGSHSEPRMAVDDLRTPPFTFRTPSPSQSEPGPPHNVDPPGSQCEDIEKEPIPEKQSEEKDSITLVDRLAGLPAQVFWIKVLTELQATMRPVDLDWFRDSRILGVDAAGAYVIQLHTSLGLSQANRRLTYVQAEFSHQLGADVELVLVGPRDGEGGPVRRRSRQSSGA